jgi:hypothetical protein
VASLLNQTFVRRGNRRASTVERPMEAAELAIDAVAAPEAHRVFGKHAETRLDPLEASDISRGATLRSRGVVVCGRACEFRGVVRRGVPWRGLGVAASAHRERDQRRA